RFIAWKRRTVASFIDRTGPDPLTVTKLGRYLFSGNNQKHRVILQKAAPAPKDEGNKRSEWVASAMIDTARAELDGDGYQYAVLEQPVVLEADTEYYLASYENKLTDDPEGSESYVERVDVN